MILIIANVVNVYHNAIREKQQANQPEEEKLIKINKLLVTKNRDLRQQAHGQEMDREKENRLAWKHAFVPPFFESEWGRRYLREKELEDKTQISQDMLFSDAEVEKRERANLNNSNFLQTSENDFVHASANNELESESIERSQPNLSNVTNRNKSSKDDLVSNRLSGNFNNLRQRFLPIF